MISPSVFHMVCPSNWRRARDSNPHGVAALSRFERGALPVGLALQWSGGEGEIRTLVADSLGALAVRWTPCSSFPLHGPLGRAPTSTTRFVARRSRAISLRGAGRRPQSRTATLSLGGSRDLRFHQETVGGGTRGDQPWDRTTFSRASAERYDHTSSLVGMEPTAGIEPAPAPYEGAVLPATLRRRGPGSRIRTPILR